MSELLFADETFEIRGAVFEVSRVMGAGFLEAVYQDCLAKEMASRRIPFVAQQEQKLEYKGSPIAATYRPDFICYGSVIVEIKALSAITGEHLAQGMNYLKATGLSVALIVNFGAHPRAEIKRIVL